MNHLMNQSLRCLTAASCRLRLVSDCQASCLVVILQSNNRCLLSTTAPTSSTCAKQKRFYCRQVYSNNIIIPKPSKHHQIRTFKNVSEYHNVADDTLHNIQDALEELIEDNFINVSEDEETPEVSYANGVLTIYLPPHGTWVINKQTPNEQLWWSSPISGPRRYEYIEGKDRWVYTRVIDDDRTEAFNTEGEDDTLGQILAQEIKQLYDFDMELFA